MTGGLGSSNQVLNDVWMLDIESGKWKEVRIDHAVGPVLTCMQISLSDSHTLSRPRICAGENVLRWWYTPAIMIFMTFFLVKYIAKEAGTEAK